MNIGSVNLAYWSMITNFSMRYTVLPNRIDEMLKLPIFKDFGGFQGIIIAGEIMGKQSLTRLALRTFTWLFAIMLFETKDYGLLVQGEAKMRVVEMTRMIILAVGLFVIN